MIFICEAAAGTCVAAGHLPEGLSFIGLIPGQGWRIFLAMRPGDLPEIVPTEQEPRNHAVHLETGRVAYIAADGTLREFRRFDKTRETTRLQPDRLTTYAQPTYGRNGKNLFVVQMKNGGSVETDIVMLTSGRKIPVSVVDQRSAQFEPQMGPDGFLYYSSVACTRGCGKSIREIWRKNFLSGEAEQVTLLNAIARQPVVSEDRKYLYFSCNKAGNYHIWRYTMADKSCRRLTEGRVADTNPAPGRDGSLYFIRHCRKGTRLMVKQPGETEREIPLGNSIRNIRDLRINK